MGSVGCHYMGAEINLHLTAEHTTTTRVHIWCVGVGESRPSDEFIEDDGETALAVDDELIHAGLSDMNETETGTRAMASMLSECAIADAIGIAKWELDKCHTERSVPSSQKLHRYGAVVHTSNQWRSPLSNMFYDFRTIFKTAAGAAAFHADLEVLDDQSERTLEGLAMMDEMTGLLPEQLSRTGCRIYRGPTALCLQLLKIEKTQPMYTVLFILGRVHVKLFYSGLDCFEQVLRIIDTALHLVQDIADPWCFNRLANAPSTVFLFPRKPLPDDTVPMKRTIFGFNNDVPDSELSPANYRHEHDGACECYACQAKRDGNGSLIFDYTSSIEAEQSGTCGEGGQSACGDEDQRAIIEADQSTLKCCAQRHKQGDVQRCTRCKVVYYCGKKCQRDHWKQGHREDCTP